ncbi:type II toxin-antitoxin system PemK/MazF family toxin [Pseudoneobacillus sp. C159]
MEIIDKVESNFQQIAKKVEELDNLSFKNKNQYVYQLKKWLFELVNRNYKIKKGEAKETVKKKRQNVYCLDFGVNVGSEFNFFHFCVVIKEFDYTAIIVPLSTEKEDDADWKSAGNLVIPIGEIEDMPKDKKPVYAMVNQIKTVSKQRLTDYFNNDDKKFYPMTLSETQMKLIFNAIKKLGEQTIFTRKKVTDTVDIGN